MEQEALLNLSEQMRVIISCALVVAAYLVDFLCCKLLIPVIRKIAARTAFKWDNYLTGGKVLHNIFHLIPPVRCSIPARTGLPSLPRHSISTL